MGGVFIKSNFSYAILPLKLIEDEQYKNLSSKEILLYTLLLNRTNLSKRNGKNFNDEKGYFVFYTNKQIKEHLRCSKESATLALKNLEEAGLICKEYQKRGLPLKIYVNEISSIPKFSEKKKFAKSPAPRDVSFNIEKAEASAKNNRATFGENKYKKTRHKKTT